MVLFVNTPQAGIFWYIMRLIEKRKKIWLVYKTVPVTYAEPVLVLVDAVQKG